MESAQPLRTSTPALLSMIFGALTFVCFLGPITALPAVICGHLGRSDVRKSDGTATGAGMALAGLILGYIGLGLSLILIVSVIIPAFMVGFSSPMVMTAQVRADEMQSRHHAQMIVQSCMIYALENEERLPPDLQTLLEEELLEAEYLVSPHAPDDPLGFSLVLTGALSDTVRTRNPIMIRENTASRNGRYAISTADGSTHSVDQAELERLLSLNE
ncbi:MAG: DUF4190 domain-containing protein [Verrucomicrobiota bacterium]